MVCCNRKCTSFALLAIGSILSIVGLALALSWNSMYHSIFKSALVLSNHSQSYGMWKETPIPLYFSIYLFNWTNSEEVIASKWKALPEFKECGPYVFSEHHIRVNTTWNANDTVTYQQIRIWHFLPELSNGTLDDTITNVNPIVATVGVKLKNLPYFVKKFLVGPALKYYEKGLVVTKSVRELLFDGFEDPLLKILKNLKLPGFSVPFDKFGWFYGRNGSYTADGTYTMYTGERNLDRLGILQLWNGKSKTGAYKGACDDVKGTSGELWPPVKEDNRITLFSSDICSTISFDFVPDVEGVNGVPGKKFIGTDFNFDNGTKYPKQACFNGEKVIPSGLRDVSKCRFGAPAFLSYPHFYLADPIYSKSIKGVVPNGTEYQTEFLMEPNTGIPLVANAKLQLNFYIEPIPYISIFDNVKPTFMPMVWFRQHATLTKKYSSKVSFLLSLSSLGIYIGWSLFGIGMVLNLLGIYFLFTRNRGTDDMEQLLGEDTAPFVIT